MKTKIYIFIIAFILPYLCYSQNLLQYPLGILYDSSHHRYLIANGNGDIIQIDSTGHQSYFMQGTSMSHGLILIGNTLYGVNSTNPRVTGYDMETGNQVFSVNTNEPRGFSGIAADSSGNLYVTNHLSNYGKIIKIRISSQTSSVFAEGNGLSYTTGIIFEKEHDRLVVCSFKRNYPFWAISVLDSTVTTLIRTNLYECFGLIKDKYGRYYVTAEAKYIYRFDFNLTKPPAMIYRSNCPEGGITALCYNQVHNQIGFAIADCNNWDLLPIHAIPNLPTLFEVKDSSTGILLRWENPSQYTDGTPLDSSYDILIYRDGSQLYSINQSVTDTSQIKTHFDITQGYHTYRILIRDSESPVNYSGYSDSLLGYGGILNSYNENFENGTSMIYRTGMWDTTRFIAHSGLFSITDNPTGHNLGNANTYFLLPSILIKDGYELEFYNKAILSSTDTAFVEISKDRRKSFSILKKYYWNSCAGWQDGDVSVGDWLMEIINLTPYLGDTVSIRFRLLSQDNNTADEGWYIDDMTIGCKIGININSRWNIISIPLEMNNTQLEEVFPLSSSEAFYYEPDSARYVIKNTLETGKSYWLKFPSSGIVMLYGDSVYVDSLDVKPGWNMIGSISKPVPVMTIASNTPDLVTSSFFTYQSGYIISDTIIPGVGYWVKVSREAKLLLSSEEELSSSNRIIIIPDNETPPLPPEKTSSVDEKQIPTKYRLYQNYPNPFNPSTNIQFDIPAQTHVRLEVFNVLGSLVKTLLNEEKDAGSYSITWDGMDNAGDAVSTGLYCYRLKSGGLTIIKKAIMMK